MSELAKNIGVALRLARKRVGMSQSVFAEKAGISQGLLSLYENGEGNPTAEQIERLFDALNMDVTVIGKAKP